MMTGVTKSTVPRLLNRAILIGAHRYSASSSGEECSEFNPDLQRITFEAMDVILSLYKGSLYMGIILCEGITRYHTLQLLLSERK